MSAAGLAVGLLFALLLGSAATIFAIWILESRPEPKEHVVPGWRPNRDLAQVEAARRKA